MPVYETVALILAFPCFGLGTAILLQDGFTVGWLSVVGISTGYFAFIAWRYGGVVGFPRCPRCHFRLIHRKPPTWCWNCGLLLRTEGLRKELEAWSSSRALRPLFSCEDEIVRCIGLTLSLMMRDDVTELSFLPNRDDYRMVAVGDGQELELEPPPPHMHRMIAVAARAMWHGDPCDNSPFDAVQSIRCDELSAAVQLTITPTPAGDSIRFQFSYPDDISTDSPTPQPAVMV